METTHRPRNVDALRAAGLLYGDWGTSKSYVIGLAIAVAGYAAFWPLLAVGILSLCVGLNYVIICRHYPNGGGVYTSARRRSHFLAALGAFFLAADYIVTAALSALAAFNYIGLSHPEINASLCILIIGLLNYFGPRHSGSFALIIAIGAVSMFTTLAIFSLPFLEQGAEHLAPLPKDPLTFWTQFCSVIVALSGVETIANSTATMKLNPKSTVNKPMVTRTSTPAIYMVMIEVVVYTTLFGLAAMAIGNYSLHDMSVSVPGEPNVDDYLLSFLAKVFGSKLLGSNVGLLFSKIFSLVVAIILLSAVNTAVQGFVSLQYLMSADNELPKSFRKVNRFGMPMMPLLVATLFPALLILTFKKVILLASLYAIGFVGAIAINLATTSTDMKLPLLRKERIFMFATFVVMFVIEITLFIQKKDARFFVISVLVTGFVLRAISKYLYGKRVEPFEPKALPEKVMKGGTLCVVKHDGKAVRAAVEEALQNRLPLYVVFIREQLVIAERDQYKKGENDRAAKRVRDFLKSKPHSDNIFYQYCVSDSFADIALAYAERLDASKVIVDAPHSQFEMLVKGNPIRTLLGKLPPHIHLVVK